MSETQQECQSFNSFEDEDIQNLRFGTHANVPSRFPDRIRFFAISDFGNITPEVKDTAAAMNRYALEQGLPDFVVGLGDNFYPYGPDSADDKIFDTVWRDQFIKPYPSLQVPWRMVLGNHDYYGNALAEVDYHYHRNNKDNVWYMPSPFYSLSVNTDQSTPEQLSADFFFMDTNGVELDLLHSYPDLNLSLRDQKVLLDRCLSESTATWRIAFAHHPMYTAGNGHGRAGDRLRTSSSYTDYYNRKYNGFGLEEVCIRNKLHGFYAGHEHVFQAHVHEGVHHYCCGASGAEIRSGDGFYCGKNSKKDYDWIARPQQYGFVVVDLTANSMTTTFVQYDGSIIRQFTRNKHEE